MGEVFTLTPMAQAEEGPPQKNTAVLISPQNHSPSLFCVDLSDLTWLFWLLSQECQALSQLSKDSRSGPLSGSTRGSGGGGDSEHGVEGRPGCSHPVTAAWARAHTALTRELLRHVASPHAPWSRCLTPRLLVSSEERSHTV